jgi:hypothetical protein
MNDHKDLPPDDGPPLTAAELRRRMAEIQMAKAEEAAAKRAKLEEAQMAHIQDFMQGHVSHDDIERLRFKVQNAIEHGEGEVEVMRFPSSLLSDKGRAVNAGRSDWPDTLTGKAADVWRIYKERVADKGYGLEARILNYPGGLLGEVGLYLTWGTEDL